MAATLKLEISLAEFAKTAGFLDETECSGKVHELDGVWMYCDGSRHCRRCSFIAVVGVSTALTTETRSRCIM